MKQKQLWWLVGGALVWWFFLRKPTVAAATVAPKALPPASTLTPAQLAWMQSGGSL